VLAAVYAQAVVVLLSRPIGADKASGVLALLSADLAAPVLALSLPFGPAMA
jgi:hypothetical protein